MLGGGGPERPEHEPQEARGAELGEPAAATHGPPTISREDITDALIRVVAEQGLDAVSIRTVAREAGVSIGSVQYHFATKDDLLLGACERAIGNVVARAAQFPDPEPAPAAYVRALLCQLLPLDDDRTAEARVAIAFTARSVNSPRLTELYALGYRALADGLAWHVLCAPGELAVDDALAALDAHLARLLPGRDRG